MLPQERTSDGTEVYEVSYVRGLHEALQDAFVIAGNAPIARTGFVTSLSAPLKASKKG